MGVGGAWRSFIGYFKSRPWLLAWLAIFAVSLIVLGAAGQIRIQGDGSPTAYELGAVAVYAIIWIVAKAFLKTDLTEEYLLGLIFGIQWEFLTHAYWTYLPGRFNVLVWKDVPLLMLMGWGASLAMAYYLSRWLGKKLFSLNDWELVFDWRILVCDAIAVSIIGVAGEWLYGIVFHCWDYNVDFGLGVSPLGLGWEIHIGYVIVMFWYGTTLRVWKLKLEGSLPKKTKRPE